MDFSFGMATVDCTYDNGAVALSTLLGMLLGSIGVWLSVVSLHPKSALRAVLFALAGVFTARLTFFALVGFDIGHLVSITCMDRPPIAPRWLVIAASVLAAAAAGVVRARRSRRNAT